MPCVRASRVGSYLQRFGSTQIASVTKPEFKSCRVSGQSTRLKLADESSRSHPDEWRDEDVLEIQADHSTLPRLSSLVTRVGTRSEREQLLASTTGLVCVTVSIGAPPGAIKTAYDVILQTAPIVVHGGTPRRGM